MIARLWDRDTTLFAPADAPDAVHAAIRHRLGWLDAPSTMARRHAEIRETIAGARADGFTHLVLLGMGGSSLCAEVLRQAAASPAAAATLTVLDTTDERAVLDVARTRDARRTLFLVASKSGGTIEVSALERFFRAWTESHAGAQAGRHFIGITDPGTPLVTHAAAAGYRDLWLNPPDIGGRYSALSLFGLIPAAWLGLDLDAMTGGGAAMADRCRLDEARNPGFALGAFMAEQAARGRDKLTVLLPEPLASLGLWIEQLVAESTGKQGRGVLPVVDEPERHSAEYGPDRAFVAVLSGPSGAAVAARARDLAAAGHPVLGIEAAPGDIGGEFFRWEFATAIAGAGLGVNPFDEPNVSDAKARTRAMLDHYLTHRAWPEVPAEVREGMRVRHLEATAARPGGAGYVGLLDYLPADASRGPAITAWRRDIAARTGAATTYGLGPRYLHSTGQYHKGGPNDGRFVLMTGADATSTDVPEAGYTFAVLKRAQALGDVAALAAAGREVVHVDAATVDATVIARVGRVLG